MTFKKFEEIFRSKYPDGFVAPHGKAGGTEKNKKTYVTFEQYGKAYEYYGAYEDVLSKIGINVISKERLAECEARLDQLRKWDGTDDFFGGQVDNSKEIEELLKRIELYKAEYIIA